VGELDDPVVVELPLRGEWTVERSPADRIPSHGTDLTPGSVAVTSGRRVRAGEVLGRVGHTGNSTAPHLHFHLMDAPDPLQAAGIPCAFAAYLVERGGQWQRVERGIPHRRQRISSVS
jgi:hypothetical protein